MIPRDGARVARARRAFASRARRRGRATRCVRHFVSREREGSGAHAPTLRRNASGRLSTSARTRARAIRTRAFLFDAPTEPPRRWRVVGVPGRGAKCGDNGAVTALCPAFSEALRENTRQPRHNMTIPGSRSNRSPEPRSRRVDGVDGHFSSQRVPRSESVARDFQTARRALDREPSFETRRSEDPPFEIATAAVSIRVKLRGGQSAKGYQKAVERITERRPPRKRNHQHRIDRWKRTRDREILDRPERCEPRVRDWRVERVPPGRPTSDRPTLK